MLKKRLRKKKKAIKTGGECMTVAVSKGKMNKLATLSLGIRRLCIKQANSIEDHIELIEESAPKDSKKLEKYKKQTDSIEGLSNSLLGVLDEMEKENEL